MERLPEILFEFQSIGPYVKVSAVDPATLTEVSVVGAAAAGRAALERLAARKLGNVLRQRGKKRGTP